MKVIELSQVLGTALYSAKAILAGHPADAVAFAKGAFE
jgi:hypothetical protein